MGVMSVNGHICRADAQLPWQLSGRKRTSQFDIAAAANDPKRTFSALLDHLVGGGEQRLWDG
jgi:hypothetical protein